MRSITPQETALTRIAPQSAPKANPALNRRAFLLGGSVAFAAAGILQDKAFDATGPRAAAGFQCL